MKADSAVIKSFFSILYYLLFVNVYILSVSFIPVAELDDLTVEDNKDLSSGEPLMAREEPLGSVNGQLETEDKENSNGTDETQAERYADHKHLL